MADKNQPMFDECEGIKEQLSFTVERLNRLRKAYAIETDPSIRFRYEVQIETLEQEIHQLKIQSDACYGLGQTNYGIIGEAVRNLHIQTGVGELQLVNCNRQSLVSDFWEDFEKYSADGTPFQFYFIPACPSQQPNSFSERMVYELIIDELDEESGAINYISALDSRRVKKEPLPLRRNLKLSQRAFKKYFSLRFGLDERKVSFEDYIATGIPKLEYHYVATVFEVNASDWNLTLMPKYIKWLLKTFSGHLENIPTFVFFVVVNIKNLHQVLPKIYIKDQRTGMEVAEELSEQLSGKEQKIFQQLLQLIRQDKNACSMITPLYPVPVEYLEDWLRNLGETNQARIDDAVQQVIRGLKEEKKARFYKDKLIDMSDIEVFQKMVYDWMNNSGNMRI